LNIGQFSEFSRNELFLFVIFVFYSDYPVMLTRLNHPSPGLYGKSGHAKQTKTCLPTLFFGPVILTDLSAEGTKSESENWFIDSGTICLKIFSEAGMTSTISDH